MSCFDEVHDLMSPTYFLGGGGGGGGGLFDMPKDERV